MLFLTWLTGSKWIHLFLDFHPQLVQSVACLHALHAKRESEREREEREFH